jgi:hypothetical protein
MKRVFIIHGWDGKPGTHWMPWLKQQLEAEGVEVVNPKMPHGGKPKQADSVAALDEVVGTPDEDTYFVAHSLGGIAVLRYIESLPSDQKVGGVVFVASFSRALPDHPLDDFFAESVDFDKIRSQAKGFSVIHSDNDVVPVEDGEILRDSLNAKYTLVHNAGHFQGDNGFYELPQALADLHELMAIDK